MTANIPLNCTWVIALTLASTPAAHMSVAAQASATRNAPAASTDDGPPPATAAPTPSPTARKTLGTSWT